MWNQTMSNLRSFYTGKFQYILSHGVAAISSVIPVTYANLAAISSCISFHYFKSPIKVQQKRSHYKLLLYNAFILCLNKKEGKQYRLKMQIIFLSAVQALLYIFLSLRSMRNLIPNNNKGMTDSDPLKPTLTSAPSPFLILIIVVSSSAPFPVTSYA